jgi:hypothetical protein
MVKRPGTVFSQGLLKLHPANPASAGLPYLDDRTVVARLKEALAKRAEK